MRHRLLIALSVFLISSCGSVESLASREPDQDKWCEFVLGSLPGDGEDGPPTDDDLQAWLVSSPEPVHEATKTFVTITTEMRWKLAADVADDDRMQHTREVLAEAYSNPDYESSGTEIEAFAKANCPGSD